MTQSKAIVTLACTLTGSLFGFMIAVMFASLFTSSLPWLLGLGSGSGLLFAYWLYSDAHTRRLGLPANSRWDGFFLHFLSLWFGASLICCTALQTLGLLGTPLLLSSVLCGTFIAGTLASIQPTVK